MPLSPEAAVSQAKELLDRQDAERSELDVLRRYWKNRQRLPAIIPADAPLEVKEMARTARVNVIDIVVESLTQALIVDGFRAKASEPDDPEAGDVQAGDAVTVPVWDAWQANRMDRRQMGLHRAAVAYGTAYMVITPGDPFPVMRPVSPRLCTAVYGDDPDWPVYVLEKRPETGTWRMYDDTSVYTLGRSDRGFEARAVAGHGAPYTPVVRYRDAEDLDIEDEPETEVAGGFGMAECRVVAGQVAPLLTLQDQINMTSFTLKAAEWYSAFRQRWIVGWTPENAAQKMKAGASQMWAFDEDPESVRLGEFGETSLDGYLKSREAALKYGATLSQTPVHELVGELVNLSAEALAAAEAGRDRKAAERKTGLGESHEQSLTLVGHYMGVKIPDDSQVIWRDTSARAFGAIVDGLGKIAQMLGVPPEELWERIPGVTQQDIRRWKAARAAGDALGNLTALLDRQAGPSAVGGERTTPGGLILPPGVAA